MWLLTVALMQVAPPPTNAHASGLLQRPGLRESSGVAVSRSHRGILWTHNDSGDGPFIYATDTTGADLGAWRVTGAEAIDWEDIAIGPCPQSAGQCLYLADTGDNGELRLAVTVYAVPEPVPGAGLSDSRRATAPATALRLAYPGGPVDVEAMYVTQDGSVYLVTKGRSRGVRLFRASKSAWSDKGVTTAELVQQLPIKPDRLLGRWVTGAATAPDGAHVVVRTYSELYVFRTEATGALAPNPAVCWLGFLEAQGEGVDFLNANTFVTTSEAPRGVSGIIHIIRCP